MFVHKTTLCQAKSIYLQEVLYIYTIYKYTNVANGKVYIGQTCKSLEERAQANGHNYYECRRFYVAIQKYLWSSFIPEVLEIVETVDEANEREIYYINLYKSTDERYGYNLAFGGDNKEMLPETKALISAKAKERYTDKTRNPMFGKKHTKEALEKQSIKKRGENNPMYGTVWTDIQRMNSGTRGKHLNLSDGQRRVLAERIRKIGKTTGLKPVRCIEDNLVFRSITEASKHYGVSISTLCGHLRGTQKSCRNRHFEYIDLEGATTIETTVA